MKNCEKFEDYLYYPEALNAAEREALKAHLHTCENCRREFERSQTIFAGLKNQVLAGHPDDEQLIRYVTYRMSPDEPDYDGKFLTREEIQTLKQHIKSCRACAERVEELDQEYKALDTYLEEAGIPEINIGEMPETPAAPVRPRPTRQSGMSFWEKLSVLFSQKSYLIPAAGLAIMALLVMINPFGNQSDSGFAELAELGQPQFSYLTRSSGSELPLGLKNLNEQNFTAAIEYLEQYIAAGPEGENATYARYACGVAYLYAARESNSPIQLDRAVEYLQQITPENANPRLQEDAAWYLGKAYLMKKDAPNARQYFEKVVHLKGRKARQAQKILTSLEKYLTNSR